MQPISKIGDYTLTRRLGVGGMGEVWMARREALGGAAREVAIKLLSPGRADNPEARRMFLDEARLSMLLRNSNIVQVYDVAEAGDGTCYMVMEYVEGLNLAELGDRLRATGERLPDVMVAFIVGEVLKALAHAHELVDNGRPMAIVHRDVSPHNVMLSVFGEVKLMDFGIARVASEETSGLHVKGKIRYMPPEQLRGETREPTLDLFAVGAMLHELLDHTKFRSSVIDEARLYGMVLDGEIPALTRPRGTIPRELDELRVQLLAARPADRIQSAREAFRRLSFWAGYRDTRFELDALVRRWLAAAPRVAPPSPGESSRSFTSPRVHADRSNSGMQGTVTAVLADASDTDIGQRSGTVSVARAPVLPSASGLQAKIILTIGIGLALLGLFGGAAALVLRDGSEPAPVEPESTQVIVAPPVEPEPAAEPVAAEPEPEPAAEVVEPEPEPEPEPELELDSEPELELDSEPELELDPEPTEAKAEAKTKITIVTGGGYAQVKLGGRTLTLDPFNPNTQTSTRLKPGRYAVSCRTQVNASLEPAGHVVIPERRAVLRVQKNCALKLE